MQSIVLSWMMMLGMLHGAGTNFPVDMFQTTSHNFGTVVKGTKTEFDFEFTNIFVEDVVIESVTSSCQCTTPSFGPRGPIKTGQKGKIHISVNTQNFTGTKNATITVRFARPYRTEMQLHSYVYIRNDVTVNPGIVYFGSVDPKTNPAVSVNINSVNQGWQIRDVQSECKFLSVELKKHPNYSSFYTMVVRLKENAPPGPFSEILEVITNDYDPRSQRVPVRVQGRVKQTLSASPSPLAFNIVEEGASVEKTLVIQGAEPFKITDITSESRNIAASIQRDARKIHPIKLTYHGNEVGDFTGEITVFTDLEGRMSTQVQFSGRVTPAPEPTPEPTPEPAPEPAPAGVSEGPEEILPEAAPEVTPEAAVPEADVLPDSEPPFDEEAKENEAPADAEMTQKTDAELGLAPLPVPEETDGPETHDGLGEMPIEDPAVPKDDEVLDFGAAQPEEKDVKDEGPLDSDSVELLDLPELENAEAAAPADGSAPADERNVSQESAPAADSQESDAPLSLDEMIDDTVPNEEAETDSAAPIENGLGIDIPENEADPQEEIPALPALDEQNADAAVQNKEAQEALPLDLDDSLEGLDGLEDTDAQESAGPEAGEEKLPELPEEKSPMQETENVPDQPLPIDGLDELPDEGPADTENAADSENADKPENPEEPARQVEEEKIPADEEEMPAPQDPAPVQEAEDAPPRPAEELDDLESLFQESEELAPETAPGTSETTEARPNESVQPIGRNLLKRKI